MRRTVELTHDPVDARQFELAVKQPADGVKLIDWRITTRPEVIDFLEPLLLPAAVLLAAQFLALFGSRFTPW